MAHDVPPNILFSFCFALVVVVVVVDVAMHNNTTSSTGAGAHGAEMRGTSRMNSSEF